MVPVMVALACHPAGSSASNKRSRSSKVLDDFKNSLNHTMVVGFAFLVNVISAKKKHCPLIYLVVLVICLDILSHADLELLVNILYAKSIV